MKSDRSINKKRDMTHFKFCFLIPIIPTIPPTIRQTAPMMDMIPRSKSNPVYLMNTSVKQRMAALAKGKIEIRAKIALTRSTRRVSRGDTSHISYYSFQIINRKLWKIKDLCESTQIWPPSLPEL